MFFFLIHEFELNLLPLKSSFDLLPVKVIPNPVDYVHL